MEYNKNRFQKTNDKKILHKIGKRWMVVSLSVLAALGGSALAASHADAHASSTQPLASQNHQPAAAHRSSLTQDLSASGSSRPDSSQQRDPNSGQLHINQQATALHRQIIQNGLVNHHSVQQSQNRARTFSVQPQTKEVVPVNYAKDNQQSNNLAPLTFRYVNQNGSEVASNSLSELRVNDDGRQSVSLNDIIKQFPVPAGYTLAPNENNNKYGFTDQDRVHDLHIVGRQITGTVNVKVTTRDVDRKATETIIPEKLTGRVGDTAKIQPNGRVLGTNTRFSWYDTKQYYIDPADNDQTVKFNPDGSLTSEDPEGVRFVYDAIGMHSAQGALGHIYVHYLDHAHHDLELPHTKVSDMNYVNEPYISAYEKNIPQGYHYLDTLISTDKFKKSDQNLQVEVAPNYDPDADGKNANVPRGYVPGWIPNNKGAYSDGLIKSDDIPDDYVPGYVPNGNGGYVPGYVPKNSDHWPSGMNGNDPIPKYIKGTVPSGNKHWPDPSGFVPDISHVSINVSFVDDSQTGRSDPIFNDGIIPLTNVKIGSQLSSDQTVRDRIPKGFKIDRIAPADVINNAGNYVVHLIQNAPQPRQNGEIDFHFTDPSDNFNQTTPLTGKVGSDFRLSSDSNLIPSGYHLAQPDHSVYQFDPQVKTVTIVLKKDQNQPQQVSAVLYYKDLNDNDRIVGHQMINGRAGSAIDYQPYINEIPQGYHFVDRGYCPATLQDHDQAVIFVESNHVHHNPLVTSYLVYRDASDGAQVGSRQLLAGSDGTNINYVPYTRSSMLPHGYEYV